jgi:hypothetical protein
VSHNGSILAYRVPRAMVAEWERNKTQRLNRLPMTFGSAQKSQF